MTDDAQDPLSVKQGTVNATFVSACLGMAVTALILLIVAIGTWNDPQWTKVIFEHFTGTIGLIAAGLTAFTIVALFQTVEGPIKLEVIGFKFEGASGPIIMWIACFLAIVAAISILWGAPASGPQKPSVRVDSTSAPAASSMTNSRAPKVTTSSSDRTYRSSSSPANDAASSPV